MEKLLQNRINLANLPTPVQFLPRLSKQYGVDIFIKRDDLTESVGSGNKLRKMEYVLSDALKHQADTLITCGGIQSNHCRTVALVAARAGMQCLLLLRGDKPQNIQGNLLIDSLLGAKMKFYSFEDFKHINRIGEQVSSELARQGKIPYYIPMGASNATGSLGYVQMIKELVDSHETYDHLYCALGSGGTYAGIILGCQQLHYAVTVHGIAVCDNTRYFLKELERIQREFNEFYAIRLDISACEELIDDQYTGIGYALNTKDELKALMTLAQTEGLVLDPVYSLKAFLGMLDHIKQGIIKPGERVLFIHTGGHYGIFPKNNEFTLLS